MRSLPVHDPVVMALRKNQRQLQYWGAIFLNRDVTIEPRLSMSYWCAAHRRVVDFMHRWPERAVAIDFDALCMAPDQHCARIAKFLGANPPHDALKSFSSFVRRPQIAGGFANTDLRQFDRDDLAYVAKIGYAL